MGVFGQIFCFFILAFGYFLVLYIMQNASGRRSDKGMFDFYRKMLKRDDSSETEKSTSLEEDEESENRTDDFESLGELH